MSDELDPFELLHRPLEPVMPASGFARDLRLVLEEAADNPRDSPAPNPPTWRPNNMVTKATTTLTPYLCATNAEEAITYYQAAFGAVETMRLVDPKDGRIGHAELSIGDVGVYLADEYPEIGVYSPLNNNGQGHVVSLALVVADADALFDRAIAAGGSVERPMENQFYGQRSGTLVDPMGYRWMISSPLEELSTDEMQRRYDEEGE